MSACRRTCVSVCAYLCMYVQPQRRVLYFVFVFDNTPRRIRVPFCDKGFGGEQPKPRETRERKLWTGFWGRPFTRHVYVEWMNATCQYAFRMKFMRVTAHKRPLSKHVKKLQKKTNRVTSLRHTSTSTFEVAGEEKHVKCKISFHSFWRMYCAHPIIVFCAACPVSGRCKMVENH